MKINLHDVVKLFFYLILFVLFWYALNFFSFSYEFGYDPLRYLYIAQSGSNYYANNSSYDIVDVLIKLELAGSIYFGYILFVALILLITLFLDQSKQLKIVLFSPIFLYYVVQTGKDSFFMITILLIFSAVINRNLFLYILSLFFILLTLYVRQVSAIFFVMIVLHLYGRDRLVYVLSITVSSVYFVFLANSESAMQFLPFANGIISGKTLGFEYSAIFFKFILYNFSILFQPIYLLYSSILLGITFIYIQFFAVSHLFYILMKKRLMKEFIVLVIPYAILLGVVSPFYHFRYLLILMPFLFFIAYRRRNFLGNHFTQQC